MTELELTEFVKKLRDIKERFIFQGGSEFALKLAAEIERLSEESARLDWFELNCRRKGATLHLGGGDIRAPKNVWAVASELDSLRDTIDTMRLK